MVMTLFALLSLGFIVTIYFLTRNQKVHAIPPLRRKHRRYVGWFE